MDQAITTLVRRGFNVATPLCAAIGISFLASGARAIELANWNFEANPLPTTASTVTGATNGPYAADLGVNAATSSGLGTHATAGTTWTAAVGNGSEKSFSSNNWLVGDYYEFQTSTTGYSNIALSVDAVSSNTGPKDFKIQYSTDGTTFTDTGATYIARGNNALNLSPYNVVAGDYNADTVVDSADYIIWRKHFGETTGVFTLNPYEGGVSTGVVDNLDYTFWRSRYGADTASSGAAPGPPYFWDRPIPPSGPPTGGSTRQTIDIHSFDLSSITALNNQATVYFRLVDISTVAANPNGTTVVATGGTSRVDNVIINGTVIPGAGSLDSNAVPEPASAVLFMIGLAAFCSRRRSA